MEHGFEFVAAQPKKRDVEDEPTRETMRGSRKIMSNPSTDQKKARRAMTKKKADLEKVAEQPVHVPQAPFSGPGQSTPEKRHPHGARPFPCKMCHGWGQDAYGQPCFRCHGTGITTTSAVEDTPEREPQGETKTAFKTAIARRASQLLNTPEEN